MPSVQIKDVPAETHAILRQRAADSHQSLQEYLRERLIAEANEPTLEEAIGRARERATAGTSTFTLADAAAAVRADRDSH